MRRLYGWLSKLGDARAASRGPGAFARRKVRSGAHRTLARAMRRSRRLRP